MSFQREYRDIQRIVDFPARNLSQITVRLLFMGILLQKIHHGCEFVLLMLQKSGNHQVGSKKKNKVNIERN